MRIEYHKNPGKNITRKLYLRLINLMNINNLNKRFANEST